MSDLGQKRCTDFGSEFYVVYAIRGLVSLASAVRDVEFRGRVGGLTFELRRACSSLLHISDVQLM